MSDPVDESFLDQYLETASSQASSLDKSRPVRQGLPSGYRMRHDAHYVDELESRRAARRPTPTVPGAGVSHEHSCDVRAARHVAGARRRRIVLQPRRRESAPAARAHGLVARARRRRAQHAGVSGAARAARGSAARARSHVADQPSSSTRSRASTRSCGSRACASRSTCPTRSSA